MTTLVARQAPIAGNAPFRLRWVLFLILTGAFALLLVPRATAAWRMYSIGPAAADYGLCMAGPTGAGLFLESDSEFRRVLRRRLVSSGATALPFARCAKLAAVLGGSPRLVSALSAPASAFREWESGTATAFSLEDLDLSVAVATGLYRRAWPLLRGEPGRLIKPSLTPPTAVHPRDPVKPAWGRGLPDRTSWQRATLVEGQQAQVTLATGTRFTTYSSSDGYAWREVPRSRAAHVERCGGPSGPFSAQVGIEPTSRAISVRTFRGQLLVHETEAVPATGELIATSCDDRGLVLLMRVAGESRIGLCPYQQRCREMNLPTLGAELKVGQYPLDMVRLDGTTVVAATMGTVVRVASTRDNGLTWTPFSVAFDAGEWGAGTYPELPSHLLALGSKVLLYSGFQQASAPYPLLISHDSGASFQGARVEPR